MRQNRFFKNRNQQDGAICHVSNDLIEAVKEFFPNKLILRGGDATTQSRSESSGLFLIGIF